MNVLRAKEQRNANVGRCMISPVPTVTLSTLVKWDVVSRTGLKNTDML